MRNDDIRDILKVENTTEQGRTQSLVMFTGSIHIITNLLLFSAFVKKEASFHFNIRSVMNGILNVL